MPRAMSDPDLKLVRRAGRGDRRALGRLYERHKKRLMGYLVRMTGNQALAEEVFQEAWIKVMRRIELFRPAEGTFRAWLYRVAGNAALDRLRYESRRSASLRQPPADGCEAEDGLDRLPSPSPDPERTAAGRLRAEVLFAAVARLPERQRAALLLRHQQGLSYPELASALGVPEGTAKTMVHRAVLALRRLPGLTDDDRGKDG